MLAYFSRIFWFVAQPAALIVALLAIALLLSFGRRRVAMRTALVAALALLAAASFTSLGYLLVQPLEARFARPAEPERIDGIVVLGGGLDAAVSAERGGWEMNRSGDRFVETLRLALRHPQARVVIAGGNPVFTGAGEPEAEAGGRFLAAFGVEAERILVEPDSRNTGENAANALALAAPRPGETWLLVTSAYHMPRSVALFRRAGFAVVPWPADYQSGGGEGLALDLGQAAENFAVFNAAMREWLALLGYWLTGRIDTPLPGP